MTNQTSTSIAHSTYADRQFFFPEAGCDICGSNEELRNSRQRGFEQAACRECWDVPCEMCEAYADRFLLGIPKALFGEKECRMCLLKAVVNAELGWVRGELARC